MIQLEGQPTADGREENRHSNLSRGGGQREMKEQTETSNGEDSFSNTRDNDRPSYNGSGIEDQDCSFSHPQGHNEFQDSVEGVKDDTDCKTGNLRKGRPGTLSCVFNSLLDLAASLAQEEMDLQASESSSTLDNVMIQELSSIAQSSGHIDLDDHQVIAAYDGFPEMICPGSPGTSNPTQMPSHAELYTCDVPADTASDVAHESRTGNCLPEPLSTLEKNEKLQTKHEFTSDIIDGFVAHSTPHPDKKPRPFMQDGLPSESPRKVRGKPPLSKGHSFDSSLTNNKNSSCEKESKKGLSRPRSLVKLFSGFLQKSDVMDTKESDTRNKGFRASLKRKFMNRSVPDIRKITSKEDGAEKIDSRSALSDSKMVRSSSSHDIRSENVSDQQKDDELHDIKEESRTSLISNSFNATNDCIEDVNRSNVEEDLETMPSHSKSKSQNPMQDLDHEDVSSSSIRHDELDDILESYKEVPKVDRSTQTELMSSAVATPAQEVSRPVPGDWHRDGNLTRPLSCPILPQESNKNLTRIVYFQEQPLCSPAKPITLHNSNLDTPAQESHQGMNFERNGLFSDLEMKSKSNSPNSSQESVDVSYDSVDDEEFGSHICIVQGCNCAVNDLSNLLESDLLTETCFTGEEFETGNEAPANEGDIELNDDDDSETIGSPEKADTDNNSDVIDDEEYGLARLEDDAGRSGCPERADEDIQSDAADDLEYDNNGNAVTIPDVACNFSSVHTHLESSRRSMGMFRSEYNRSFDEDDSDDESTKPKVQPTSPQSATEVECDNKEVVSDLTNLAMDIANVYAKPDKDSESLIEDVSVENRSSISTLSLISSCTEESVNADIDLSEVVHEQIKCKDSEVDSEVFAMAEANHSTKADNVRSPDASSTCFCPLLSPDATRSCYSPMLSDTETETSSLCAVNDVPLSADKVENGRRDSSYDIVNALDELSSVLDDELCLGIKNEWEKLMPASLFHISTSSFPNWVFTHDNDTTIFIFDVTSNSC